MLIILDLDIVLIKTTMQNVYLLMVIAVEHVSTQNTVQNVCATKEENQLLIFHVSNFFYNVQKNDSNLTL